MGIFETIIKAATTAVAKLGQTLIPETPLWNQFSRIGGSLGPAEVTNIIREAGGGRPARLVDLVHACRQKDGHMQAVLGTRELAIVGLPWGIAPPPEPTEEEVAQAALCEAAIRSCADFPVLLAHLTGEGCLFPVGAWSEIVWTVPPVGRFAGLEIPAEFPRVNCRRFGFRRSDGRLVFVEYGKDPETSGIDLLEEYGPGNFIHYQPRVNGDVQVREGLASVFAWMAIFRNWGIRDWMMAGEMGWKPWRIATYSKSADGKDRELAELIINTLTATGAAAVPDSVKLDVSWPKSTGSNLQSVHRELVEFFGQEMSKAALGQTLTTEAGSRGARALGEVHDGVRGDIKEADATGVGASLDRDLVGPFYAFNWPTARRGHFVFRTEEGVDIKILKDVIKDLADKLDIPEDWAREQLGIRKPKDEEPLCGGRERERDADNNTEDDDLQGAA